MGFFSAIFGTKENSQLIEAIKGGAVLVDVRTPGEFLSGSVKGAINIPLAQIQNRLSTLKGEKNIMVFCRSGASSSQAKNMLAQNSFSNVTDGGSWKNVNDVVNAG